MERRFASATAAPVKLAKRADGEGEGQNIVGYGAVYYDGTAATEYVLWEYSDMRCVERIVPGAFNRAIAESQDVRGLFNHDPNLLLGRTASGTMSLVSDKRGLRYEITPDDTSIAIDVMKMLKRGDVTGSSFSFVPIKEVRTEVIEGDFVTIVREVHDVDLWDAGPVTYPAYVGSEAGLRSISTEADNRREYEAAVEKRSAAKVSRAALDARLAAIRQRAAAVK